MADEIAPMRVTEAPDNENEKFPYRVLGIALVVDQKGKEAKMVLRYPTMPYSSVEAGDDKKDDLFFRLGPRSMAKLFRPKPTLCDQPMTLAVGGTVFCCRAILMNVSEDIAHDEEVDRVNLFSVIVALVPQVLESAIPITGWFADHESRKTKNKANSSSLSAVEDKMETPRSRATASFLSVRRVHISLARLCRVLQREERRCQYVSLQTNLCSKIRQQLRTVSSAVASPVSISSKKTKPRLTASFSRTFDRGEGTVSDVSFISRKNSSEENARLDEAEREQEILETIMAAPPPKTTKCIEHRGNLASELVRFYHALGRNDHPFPPTPSLLLTGRDGIVYINGHIAVSVEAVAPRVMVSSSEDEEDGHNVRPYETLLFPHASPKELLESLSLAGATAPRRLQQLLLTVNPQKPLTDIALDANLSLQATLEIAAYLVLQGAALTSPVISRQSCLVCERIDQIYRVSLDFAHEFGADINLFVLVAFLTKSCWTLGEALTTLRTSDEPEAGSLRSRLSHSIPPRPATSSEMSSVEPSAALSPARKVNREQIQHEGDLEDLVFQMAVWLCSRRVLVHLKEYLVAISPLLSGSTSDSKVDSFAEKKVDFQEIVSDETLFRDLIEADCLSGTISLQACSWRTGIDMSRLRALAHQHEEIQVIFRVAVPGDDWTRSIGLSNDGSE